MQTMRVAAPSLRPNIVIAASEYARLTALAERAVAQDSAVGEYLAEELVRAHVVPDEHCAFDVVRMGSHVTYRDATGKTRAVTVVYPNDADISAQRISVLTPIGAALIGLRPGQSIQWLTPGGGESSLEVLTVENAAVGV
jgi:regulator of nucleoside diphosphate kinase